MIDTDYKKFTKQLIRKNLSPNQFYVCTMLYQKNIKELFDYIESNGDFDKREIDDLIEKGYIITTLEGVYNPKNLVVTPLFDDVVILEEEMMQQFYDEYPPFIHIVNAVQNSLIPAKTQSSDSLVHSYMKAIRYNPETHEKVMQSLRILKAKNNNKAPCNIVKFIDTRAWEAYLTLKSDIDEI